MRARLRDMGGRLVRQRWLWWLGVLVWAGVLFILSSDTAPPSGPDFPFMDKVLHCAYFTAGSACFLVALFGEAALRINRLRLAAAGVLFTAAVGALDEFHQTFTPGRMGNDPWDWLADVTGGALGVAVALTFLRWMRRPSH